MVWVSGYGTQYFWPLQIAFTQDTLQYKVDMSDIGDLWDVSTNDTLTEGRLLEGVIACVAIRIPQGIDTSKEFRVWYGNEYGTIRPDQPVLDMEPVGKGKKK